MAGVVRTVTDRQWIIPSEGEWYRQGTFDRTKLTTPLVSGTILTRTAAGLLDRWTTGATAVGICTVGLSATDINMIDDADCVVDFLVHGRVIENKLPGAPIPSAVKTQLPLISFE